MALACLTSCSDDPVSVTPEPFSVTLQITDDQGDPVEGLRVASMPVVPGDFWEPPLEGQDHPRQLMVQVSWAVNGTGLFVIHDVAGVAVRTLYEGEVMAGVTSIPWDGRDDDGAPLPGGWYEARITPLDEGENEAEAYPLILSVCDPDWHMVGTTDSNGRLVLTDRTLVPGLYDVDQVIGAPLTTNTLFRLENDLDDGQYMTVELRDEPTSDTITWDPPYTTFRLVLTVVNDLDVPVPDLGVGLMPALPDWVLAEDQQRSTRTHITIPIELESERLVLMTIEDIAGTHVRTLLNGELVAGRHIVGWDGRNDTGQPTAAGYYEVVLQTGPAGSDILDSYQSRGVLQILEGALGHSGVTDEQGRVTIDDRRLVPGFWDVAPMTITSEEAEVRGVVELGTDVWVVMGDFLQVALLSDVTDGAQTATVKYRQPLKPDGGQPKLGGNLLPPPNQAELLPPYPNPFN